MPPCNSCCATIGREFNRPMFDLVERRDPSRRKGEETSLLRDRGGAAQVLDIAETFSPTPRPPLLGARALICAWMLSTLALSLEESSHPSFWLAYLTHWGFLIAVSYCVFSVATAIFLAMYPPAQSSVLEGGADVLVKITWALFATALPCEIVIAILYWTLEFDGNITYTNIMVHGGGIVLVAADGFLISRIPFRMRQIAFVQLFAFLYFLWSIVEAYSGIENPNKEDGVRDDDAIYTSLAWKNRPIRAATTSLIAVFVVCPATFLLARELGQRLPKRLCRAEGSYSKDTAVRLANEPSGENP